MICNVDIIAGSLVPDMNAMLIFVKSHAGSQARSLTVSDVQKTRVGAVEIVEGCRSHPFGLASWSSGEWEVVDHHVFDSQGLMMVHE